jgi:hypothetical protein
MDPLVIDLTGAGINLVAETQASPYFNWTVSNFANQAGWIGSGTGFLVSAPTNGESITAANLVTSFAALQALDINHTGTLNSSAPGFANLEVWVDTNGDGVAEPDELFTLAQLGIQSFNLGDQTTSQILAGNTIEAVSSVTMTDGSTNEIAAVAFDYSTTYTEYLGSDTPSPAAAALPQLHGYGNLTDLQEAMTNDPTLLGMVQSFTQMSITDSTALGTAIANIMFEWAGVAAVDPTSRGPFDARELGFLEQFLGTSFRDAHGNVDPVYTPELTSLAQSWNAAFDGIAARLLLQGPMAADLTDFAFDPSNDLIICATSFGQALQDVAAQAPSDPTFALQYWWAAVTVLDSYVADWQAIDTQYGVSVVPATQAAYDAMLTAVAPELTAAELTTLRSLSFGDNAETGTGGSGVFTYTAGNATTATLVLGAGIEAAQLAATADAQGDLLVTDGIAGDQIKLDWMMLPCANGVSAFGVQTVQFADGTTWTAEPYVGGLGGEARWGGSRRHPLQRGTVVVGWARCRWVRGGRAGGRVWCGGAPPSPPSIRFAAQAPARGEGEDGAAAPCKAGRRRRRWVIGPAAMMGHGNPGSFPPIASAYAACVLDFRPFPPDMRRVRALGSSRHRVAGPTAPDPDRTTY